MAFATASLSDTHKKNTSQNYTLYEQLLALIRQCIAMRSEARSTLMMMDDDEFVD